MADDTIELELTGMAHGGSAVGRHEGRAVFAAYGIPGERVRARITQDKKHFAKAQVIEVLEAAPARTTPRCPHFGVCGGCHWQHIDYAGQLVFKQQVVADQMRRIGGFQEAVVHPTLPSPDAWNYRSHVTFQVAPDGRLGFIMTDGRTVLPIQECHIIRPELLDMFYRLNGRAPEAAARVRLQVGSESDDRLIAGGRGGDDEGFRALSGGERVHYHIKGRDFRVSAGSFFQVNQPQAAALVDLALERLVLDGGATALDLYAGVGLFTAFLAERAKQVTAVESFPPAVGDARANLAGFDNVELVEGLVEAALPDLPGPFEVALADPPRTGIDPGALDALMMHAPRRFVYVSCDPATLARDARRLAEGGYRLIDVQPVDMFPQTYHVEAVAAFTRD